VQIKRGSLLAAVGAELQRKKHGRVAISPSRLSLAGWDMLKKSAGKSARWVRVEALVDELRAVKDPSEIDRLRDAARLGSEVMGEAIHSSSPASRNLRLPLKLATGCA